MPIFWDLLPASLWPTQPFIPPIDPGESWGKSSSPATPWESAASTPDYLAPDALASSGPWDDDRYRQMLAAAKRASDFARWTFGPPNARPQAPTAAPMPTAPMSGTLPTASSFIPPVDPAQAASPLAPPPYGTADADMAAAQAAREAAAARIRQAAQPRGGRQESAGADLPAQFIGGLARSGWKAIADVPHEIGQAFTDQWGALKHHAWTDHRGRLQDYLANPSFAKAAQHQWEDFKDAGKSALDLAGLPFAPIQGAARSLIGHPYADLAQLVASHFNPAGAPNPDQRYDEAKRAVDTALMGLGPRGGSLRPPFEPPLQARLPPPARPIEPPPPPTADNIGNIRPRIEPAPARSELLRSPTLPLPQLAAPPGHPLLAGPPPGTEQPWQGPIYSRPVAAGGEAAYRSWGGESKQVSDWLSPYPPASSSEARRDLALWPGNTAQYVSKVQIPAGTQIQWGKAARAFGQPGGATQIQLLEDIPAENYGPGLPLPAK